MTEALSLVDVFVATVVAGAWVALRILVLHNTAKSVEHGLGGEVLRWDEIDEVFLAVLLLL